MSNLIENVSTSDYEISLSVQFWLYLISDILAIICCLFVLLYDRTLRHEIHNHVIFVLLCIGLIYDLVNIPFVLYNYHFGIPWESSWILYRFWSFIDIGVYTTHLIIFAWGTIERYIIVFHNQWLSTKKKRFYIHYVPIILLIIYCLIWYSIVILFLSCETNSNDCMMYNSPNIKYFDLICHQVIPSIVIIIFSIVLLFRVPPADQIKQRKMIFEILCLSILCFVFYGPWLFVLISLQFNSLENIGLNLMPYAYFFSYYFIFLFPFVCCASLPKVLLKLKNLFCRQRQQT